LYEKEREARFFERRRTYASAVERKRRAPRRGMIVVLARVARSYVN